VRFFPLVLLGFVVSAGSSCVEDPDDECGGPTSDWPAKVQCDRPGSATSDEGSESPSKGEEDGPDLSGAEPPRDNGTKKDAGKGPIQGAMDAGSSTKPETPPGLGEPSAGGDASDAGSLLDASAPSDGESDAGVPADAQVHDGGRPSGLDGGVPSRDSGAPRADAGDAGASCTLDSDGRDVGACFGVYCHASAEELSSNLSDRGQCLSSGDVELVCDGELSRVVDGCAQDNALALGFGSMIRECAREADTLSDASPGCIDCYVDEILCAVDNCLTPCLAGRSASCTECRTSRCGGAFQRCSGLPRPSSL